MRIRPLAAADLAAVVEIDGTIESTGYLHVDQTGRSPALAWKIDSRPLRAKWIDPNRLNEDRLLDYRQAAGGVEEGPAIVAEHEGRVVAAAVAQADPAAGILRLLDLRVDYDNRRQGLASALVFQIIQAVRQAKLRAVAVEARTNNLPANEFLAKLNFEMGGLDLLRCSNHDLVKETVTLFWYLPLE